MNEYNDNTFLARWLNGELSEAEQEDFVGSEDHSELTRLLNGVDKLAPQTYEGEQLLSKIKAAIAVQQNRGARVRRLHSFLLAAAAGIAILFAAWYFWPKAEVIPQYALHEVKVDEKPLEASFPDGSRFALNKSSRLEYDKASWGESRAVRLEGEAYFEVVEGEEFLVSSSQGKVRVLGTRFNVVSRDNFFQVDCFEGRVEVFGEGFEMKVLSAGQSYRPIPQIQIPGTSVLRTIPDGSQGKEWLEGVTLLSSMTLKQIATAFENHYEIKVALKDGLEENEDLHSPVIPHDNLRLAIETTFGALYIDKKLIRVDTSKLESQGQLHVYRGK